MFDRKNRTVSFHLRLCFSSFSALDSLFTLYELFNHCGSLINSIVGTGFSNFQYLGAEKIGTKQS